MRAAKEKIDFVVEIPAKVNLRESVETLAKDMNKSEHVSPLDACTCTGNCGSGKRQTFF